MAWNEQEVRSFTAGGEQRLAPLDSFRKMQAGDCNHWYLRPPVQGEHGVVPGCVGRRHFVNGPPQLQVGTTLPESLSDF